LNPPIRSKIVSHITTKEHAFKIIPDRDITDKKPYKIKPKDFYLPFQKNGHLNRAVVVESKLLMQAIMICWKRLKKCQPHTGTGIHWFEEENALNA